MIEIPTVCPECGTETISTEDPKSKIISVWCPNVSCVGRVREDLVAVANRDVLEIDSLGPELAQQLSEGGYVLDLADLFEFAQDCRSSRARSNDLFESKLKAKGFSVTAVNKMLESCSQALTRDWINWLVALNIEGIGKVLAKQLVMALEIDSMATLCAKLKKVGSVGLEGFGDKKVESVVAWANDHDELCQRLYDIGVRPKNSTLKLQPILTDGQKPLAGMAVCVTGEHLGLDREVIQARLKALGAEIKSGVSKKLTHLVAGMGAGPSKLTKARELGILVLDTKWLKGIFEANGFKINPDGDFDDDVEI